MPVIVEDVEAEFKTLEGHVVSSEEGDKLDLKVRIDEVYDLSALKEILKGSLAMSIDNELQAAISTGEGEAWDPALIMHSLGV